jgi:predicted metal-dependent phosphoesterase TrpH
MMISVRVAAHVHSSWSYDAEWSLQDIATAFRKRRYDVVLMSEHDRSFDQQRWMEYQKACIEASTDNLLLIPGIEYEDTDNVVHTPVWGTNVPFLGSGRPTLDLLRLAQAEGAVATLAHPWRRNAISRYQSEWAPLLSAIEVWNRKYDGFAPHREARRLAEQEGLGAFVALDFHTSRQFFPLAMSVSLQEKPSSFSLIEAIRDGRCRPEFLGFSALRFTRGLEGATLRSLEAVRRGMREPLRRLQRVAI